MPPELHLQNTNLSDSHYSSLLITAWRYTGWESEVENSPGWSIGTTLLVVVSRSLDPRRDTAFIVL